MRDVHACVGVRVGEGSGRVGWGDGGSATGRSTLTCGFAGVGCG